jgi:hypothetical protein
MLPLPKERKGYDPEKWVNWNTRPIKILESIYRKRRKFLMMEVALSAQKLFEYGL